MQTQAGANVALQADISIVIGWLAFAAGAFTCMLLVFGYDVFDGNWPKARQRAGILGVLLAGWTVGVMYACADSLAATVVLGDIVPLVIVTYLFVPQLTPNGKGTCGEFKLPGDGYCVGLAVISIAGCCFSMAATALDDQNGYRMVARWPGGWHGLVSLIPYGLLAIGNLCVLLGWICNACEDAGTSRAAASHGPSIRSMS